jgi:2-polyprenyl-6-methoxyphenol hydroxylase-like FAD-dependent oxidoreductase
MPAAQTALAVGGGIAGPVTATALSMAGIDAAVFEARPSDPSAANGIGGSLALEPNGWPRCASSTPTTRCAPLRSPSTGQSCRSEARPAGRYPHRQGFRHDAH